MYSDELIRIHVFCLNLDISLIEDIKIKDFLIGSALYVEYFLNLREKNTQTTYLILTASSMSPHSGP